jgi:hypothetical protein
MRYQRSNAIADDHANQDQENISHPLIKAERQHLNNLSSFRIVHLVIESFGGEDRRELTRPLYGFRTIGRRNLSAPLRPSERSEPSQPRGQPARHIE